MAKEQERIHERYTRTMARIDSPQGLLMQRYTEVTQEIERMTGSLIVVAPGTT